LHQSVNGQLTGFTPKRQLEAIFEERLQHRHQLARVAGPAALAVMSYRSRSSQFGPPSI